MSKNTLQRFLGAALIFLAAASIYLSYGALFEFALAAGFPPERAGVFPVILDVVTVVSLILAITVETGKVYSFITLAVFGAATIAGNALHVTTLPASAIQVPLPVAIVASAIPAVSLLLVTHLAAMTIFKINGQNVVTEMTNQRPHVKQLFEDGLGIAEIQRLTGVPRSTVTRWLKTA
jgi:hypothetical protein